MVREEKAIFLLSITRNNVVSVRGGFLFLLVLMMDCVILSWHSLDLPYNDLRYKVMMKPILMSLYFQNYGNFLAVA